MIESTILSKMSRLRQFWFPLFLTTVGIGPLFFAGSATENTRKAMLTFSAFFLFLAVLSYLWGDPVKEPSAFITHPGSPEKFVFYAGVPCVFSVKALADGIDFSKCLRFEGQAQPIELCVRKTWWSGLQVRLVLLGSADHPMVVFEGGGIAYLEEGYDLNHDNFALEVITRSRAPIFQLVIAEDYEDVCVNALIGGGPNEVLVLKNRSFRCISPDHLVLRGNNLDRIFRYPSYMYPGVRE